MIWFLAVLGATDALLSGLELGLPLLPSGRDLVLSAPGWKRRGRGDTRGGDGTSGRVWPAAGTLARQLLDAEVLRGGSILELGAGSGALGCWASAALGGELRLTDVDEDARALCRENAAANGLEAVTIEAYALGAPAPAEYREASLILAADVTYDIANIGPLCATLEQVLPMDDSRTPPVVLAAHQHRPLASLLGRRSTLRRLKKELDVRGLAFHELCTEELFAKVVVFEVTRQGRGPTPLATGKRAPTGAGGFG